jgi:hypothetical protein
LSSDGFLVEHRAIGFNSLLCRARECIKAHQPKHPFEPKENLEAITLYTKSVQCLQKRLQTPVDGLSEGVIVSVLEFAFYDVRKLILPQALREILINGQISCAGSRPVACSHGWSHKHHSA